MPDEPADLPPPVKPGDTPGPYKSPFLTEPEQAPPLPGETSDPELMPTINPIMPEPQPNPVPQTTAPTPAPTPKKSHLLLYLFIAVMAIVIAAAVSWFMLFNNKPEKTTIKPPTVSVEPGKAQVYFTANNTILRFDEKTQTIKSGEKAFEPQFEQYDSVISSPDGTKLLKIDNNWLKLDEKKQVTSFTYSLASGDLAPKFEEIKIDGYQGKQATTPVISDDNSTIVFSDPTGKQFIIYNVATKKTTKLPVELKDKETAHLIAANAGSNSLFWMIQGKSPELQASGNDDTFVSLRVSKLDETKPNKLPDLTKVIKEMGPSWSVPVVTADKSALYYTLLAHGSETNATKTDLVAKVQRLDLQSGKITTVHDFGVRDPGFQFTRTLLSNDGKSLLVSSFATVKDKHVTSIYRVGTTGGEFVTLHESSAGASAATTLSETPTFATAAGSLFQSHSCTGIVCGTTQEPLSPYTWAPVNGPAKTVKVNAQK